MHLRFLSCDRHCCALFFFTLTATTEIYTLSLHDALPIFRRGRRYILDFLPFVALIVVYADQRDERQEVDRKSTRLNSSHLGISYAVFCLKKKKKIKERQKITE